MCRSRVELVGLPDICATVDGVDRYDRGGHDLPGRLALDGSCCSTSLVLMYVDLQTSPCLDLLDVCCWRRNAAGERSSENPLSVGPPTAAASSSCSLQRHGSLAGPSPRGTPTSFRWCLPSLYAVDAREPEVPGLTFARGAPLGACLLVFLAIRNLKRETTQLHCHCSPRLSLCSPPSYE